MLDNYRLIMDADENPLRPLPPVQRFQLMTYLGLMWTAIFCTAFGAWYWFGHLIIGHVLLALGLTVTGVTFRLAHRRYNPGAHHIDKDER